MANAGTDSPVVLPVSVRDFTKLWRSDRTVEDVAVEIGVTPDEVRAIAKQCNLKPKKSDGPDISPEELQQRAAEVRAGWSEQERRQRIVYKTRSAGFHTYQYDSRTGIFTYDAYSS